MAFLSLEQLAYVSQVVTAFFSAFVVAGLIVALRGYRRQVEDSRTELLTGMTKYLNEVARVFVEYPRMKKYFHDNCRPGYLDRPRAEAIALTLANAMDHVTAHLEQADSTDRGAWESYFDHVLCNSPVLRDYLRKHWPWYGSRLQARLRCYGIIEPATAPR